MFELAERLSRPAKSTSDIGTEAELDINSLRHLTYPSPKFYWVEKSAVLTLFLTPSSHHRQLRGRVSQESMKQLVTSLVLSRIDYCNVVLAGLPASTIAPLQRVQNAAAHLFLRLDRRSHITPAFREPHWLPVKYRIKFKVAVFMHQVTAQRCPSYVADLVAFSTPDSQRRSLRSASTNAAVIRRTRTEFGRRAFAVCGPDIWILE